jgi:hypothetical protein
VRVTPPQCCNIAVLSDNFNDTLVRQNLCNSATKSLKITKILLKKFGEKKYFKISNWKVSRSRLLPCPFGQAKQAQPPPKLRSRLLARFGRQIVTHLPGISNGPPLMVLFWAFWIFANNYFGVIKLYRSLLYSVTIFYYSFILTSNENRLRLGFRRVK